MPGLPRSTRLRFLADRARRINVGSVLHRARGAAQTHHKWTPAVAVDMLWQAGFHGVGFQDYVDYDFALLTRRERATYMTSPFSHELAQKLDDPAFRHLFHDKVAFNKVFRGHLGRDWMVVEPGNAEQLMDFAIAHGTIITKKPNGRAGNGVHRYNVEPIVDWSAFHRGLLERGEILVEQVIDQHHELAAFCPGTVNTTRVTAYFDGETTHILSAAQKFGRGGVSDQNAFGGFYVMLDEHGRATGAGYDSRGNVYDTHPDSGLPVADFTLPLWDEVTAFVDRVARVVPTVRYVGWDIAVTDAGPILVEGNWAAGVYENKASATGIRTGTKARFLAAIGEGITR
ncbi:sugar-transfer associated ATP-grasp domain-containing protein [Microbacterium sp. 77mftsu3.1]|uniref:sugar-transfer associated ATP-grasp domain-containing protein n=1 Tax=Microbacterium sp. 77mftsu3.1 TaxID=1761802 RepID=UPI000382DEA5|nr:sugar-transfer associated ATP-grasp domain-containing protein [Microbacterium sp. 77mftsu3.1]SDH51237.1 Sugar-transfer associated ATP-grasp [Microbacterium sp. 77mftsu3.1]